MYGSRSGLIDLDPVPIHLSTFRYFIRIRIHLSGSGFADLDSLMQIGFINLDPGLFTWIRIRGIGIGVFHHYPNLSNPTHSSESGFTYLDPTLQI